MANFWYIKRKQIKVNLARLRTDWLKAFTASSATLNSLSLPMALIWRLPREHKTFNGFFPYGRLSVKNKHCRFRKWSKNFCRLSKTNSIGKSDSDTLMTLREFAQLFRQRLIMQALGKHWQIYEGQSLLQLHWLWHMDILNYHNTLLWKDWKYYVLSNYKHNLLLQIEYFGHWHRVKKQIYWNELC